MYQGTDGWWHGRVTVGYRADGRLDRRHVQGPTKGSVVGKVRDLERNRDAGQVRKAGQRWTLAAWLEHWLEHIAEPSLRPTSFAAYRTAVYKHLIPRLGGHRLDRLEPEHLERLYREMIKGGAKPGTAHQVHRTVRTALGEAQRRGHVARNVAALAKPPRVQVETVQPYTVDEVRAILAAAGKHPNRARWAIALALGLRQGEALGLKWADVDLDHGLLHVRSTRVRPIYAHGCDGTCGKKPGWCPQRILVNGTSGLTKSDAGRRAVGLPDQLVQLLRDQQKEQSEMRQRARQLWEDGDWVFTSPTGAPLNPNSDYHRWKALLKEAGVRDARLHDARHTAATVLLVLGVPERTVMGIMGWSSTAMAARYQHVTDPIRKVVAGQVGGLLWAAEAPSEDPIETRSETTKVSGR
ncbi:site-specific integrase [Microlunatus endophyticus]